jgi:hypothetical protein
MRLSWLLLLLLLLLQIHGCHCKHCKKSDASSNEAAPGGDCFTLDDAAGADLAANPFAAAAVAAAAAGTWLPLQEE